MPSIANSSAAKRKILAAQAKALKAKRAELGLTQKQAAEQLGLKEETYLAYEHGVRRPRPGVRATIETTWNLPPKVMGIGDGVTCPTCGRHF